MNIAEDIKRVAELLEDLHFFLPNVDHPIHEDIVHQQYRYNSISKIISELSMLENKYGKSIDTLTIRNYILPNTAMILSAKIFLEFI